MEYDLLLQAWDTQNHGDWLNRMWPKDSNVHYPILTQILVDEYYRQLDSGSYIYSMREYREKYFPKKCSDCIHCFSSSFRLGQYERGLCLINSELTSIENNSRATHCDNFKPKEGKP